jgi:hypothetical protein
MAAGGGWFIQGERGSGKSLAAVGKAKEYLERGCPVATNLDLYLDKLVPVDNKTLAYRLPDYPRLDDFQLLPPAYDVNYKDADKNGLLILDEIGAILNSRNWNDKERLGIVSWLFQSRKYHWDLIILCQDIETIDNQLRNTLCDYLVIASRLDRQKIPVLGSLLSWLGFNAYMPKIHVYHVFYGISTQNDKVDTWRFSGKDLYNAYNTNQIFKRDNLITATALTDMRSVYTYLPAYYLTGQVHVEKLSQRIKFLNDVYKMGDDVAVVKRGIPSEYPKMILVVAVLLYQVFSPSSPSPSASVIPAKESAALVTQPQPQPVNNLNAVTSNNALDFLSSLLSSANPFLSSTFYSSDAGFVAGTIRFKDKKTSQIIDSISISDLHSYDAYLMAQSFGAYLYYKGQRYLVRRDSLESSVAVVAVESKAKDKL